MRKLLFLLLGLAFGLLFIEPMWLLRGDFGSDDSSYFSHAATLALDLDLDYANEPVVTWSADHNIAAGSPGAGWVAAPFVAAFGIIDRIQGHPIIDDHGDYTYSWSLFGFFVAAILAFGLGVWLYREGIAALWPDIDPRLNLLLAASTGIPVYVLRRFTMAHAFEFAACALAFWAAAGLYRALARDARIRPWIVWSAVAAAANLAIRVNNLNTLVIAHIVVLLLYVFDATALPRPRWRAVWRSLLQVTGAIALALLPLAVFSWVVYGAPYPTPAIMYGQPLTGTAARTTLEVLAHGLTLVPNLVPLVFSSEFGILYTNPVLVLGGGFLVVALTARLVRERDLPHALALLLVLGFFGLCTAIVLWWQTTATSYGYRYLFPLYPVALLGLLIAVRGADRSRGTVRRRVRRALMPAAIVLAVVSITSQLFFSASSELEVRPQVNVFGVHHSASARGYLTRLPVEMVDPDTWSSLAARRLAGFYVAPYVAESSMRARMPEDWLDSYDRLYRDVPVSAYIQLTLVLLLSVALGWWLMRPPAARSKAEAPDRPSIDPASPTSAMTASA